MRSIFLEKALKEDLAHFYNEDDLHRNFHYLQKLPKGPVSCQLKIKDNMIMAGLPVFFETFNYLLESKINYDEYANLEGKRLTKGEVIKCTLPFNVALTGERIALNLLQKMCSIATYTNKFVEIAKEYNIAILDTRKTTPGFRALEKYAVVVGGGFNHRFGQSDVWMIKDNHKTFFGGLKQAIDYFQSLQGFYVPLVCEIHTLLELEEAIKLKVQHVMLDNFSPADIKKAISMKTSGMTFEVSGGIRLENIQSYCLEGVDAISIGALTNAAPSLDISFKFSDKI